MNRRRSGTGGTAPGLAQVLALALALCLAAGPALAQPLASARWAQVLYINDGDTITVRLEGRRELVRLLGVDAPETEHSTKLLDAARRAGRSPEAEASLGRQARSFVQGLLPRRSLVRLAADPMAPPRDQYGRLLVYVFLEDGRMLNELLLAEGQAVVYQRCQCARLGRFQQLQRQARQERRGLWAPGLP